MNRLMYKSEFILFFIHLLFDLRYLGSYVPDSNGRLLFREGPLVEAVRKGYWVILDELNLAPSDVIETLNRVSHFTCSAYFNRILLSYWMIIESC